LLKPSGTFVKPWAFFPQIPETMRQNPRLAGSAKEKDDDGDQSALPSQ
jgi:hypothetical protein